METLEMSKARLEAIGVSDQHIVTVYQKNQICLFVETEACVTQSNLELIVIQF